MAKAMATTTNPWRTSPRQRFPLSATSDKLRAMVLVPAVVASTRRLMTAFFVLVAALLSWVRPAQAGELKYGSIDRATVRVLALGKVRLEEVEPAPKKKVILAMPVGGHGSGFIVDKAGYIVTAAHVVASARAVAVLVPGVLGPLPARVVELDETRDYAVLKVPGPLAEAAPLAPTTSELAVRDEVFAVGYPLDANRADPQSTKGIVSGLLPDGRLQLGINVNPGNSGGPVIDAAGNVVAIVVSRASVKDGEIGLAAAVPVAAFRPVVAGLATKPLISAEDDANLNTADARKLADLLGMLAYEGPALMRDSVDADSEEAQRRWDQISRLYQQMPKSPDVNLLAAAFFWNRYVALSYDNKPSKGAYDNALALGAHAAKLDPTLKSDPFVTFLAKTSAQGAPPAVTTSPVVDVQRDTDGVEVTLTASEPGTDFYLLRGSATAESAGGGRADIDMWQRLCTAPCTARIPSGSVRFALAARGERPRPAGYVDVTQGSHVQGTYERRSGTRAAGWVVFGLGALTGSALMATASSSCDASSCSDGTGQVIAGGLVTLLGLAVGLPLAMQRDSATVSAVPAASAPQTPRGGVASLRPPMPTVGALTFQF